ncbi:porphobilinogen deaminase isoform X1 [Euwallacea fornicatus]|uniref:porphobilinogen deaminase isoform X1 n=2 Tax=Euwallacea fornicatus TaxID=995702 RepID=UPI00338F0548
MSGELKLRVGSRKSELALIQTRHVISCLKQIYPDIEFDVVTMSTLGDQIIDIPLPKIGEKSLFTKELETALADGHVDFIVHSLKDLPTILPVGMAIGAVLSRENPRDALVLQRDIKKHTLASLPEGSVIGTSSLRRTAQLAKKYPHLKVENIRGNLNTRLKKLDDLGKYHAIILASAGLVRIGWKNRISKMLDAQDFLYAVGQGAIAVECRADDEKTLKLLEPLYDLQTALRVIAERSFLKTLGGGCSAPVAVISDLKLVKDKEVKLTLKGAVWSLDGTQEVADEGETVVNVLSSIRCAECPYSNGELKVIDIECCVTCPMNNEVNGPSLKKQKLDIPNEILENDPHDKLPVPIPIGSDFMGQCPFLEGTIQGVENPHLSLNGDASSIAKLGLKFCPALKGLNSDKNNVNKVTIIEDDCLFVGLVPHRDATFDNLMKSKLLGENLALKLKEKGALQIMAAAQAAVHGKISNNTAAS